VIGWKESVCGESRGGERSLHCCTSLLRITMAGVRASSVAAGGEVGEGSGDVRCGGLLLLVSYSTSWM